MKYTARRFFENLKRVCDCVCLSSFYRVLSRIQHAIKHKQQHEHATFVPHHTTAYNIHDVNETDMRMKTLDLLTHFNSFAGFSIHKYNLRLHTKLIIQISNIRYSIYAIFFFLLILKGQEYCKLVPSPYPKQIGGLKWISLKSMHNDCTNQHVCRFSL